MTSASLSIFVHFAPGILTDHESNGEGLVAYSLLNGLAERGHRLFVYTSDASISRQHPNIQIKSVRHTVWANSLAPWEYLRSAERWLKSLTDTESIDIVWRMYGGGCPRPPLTQGRPLVVGPLSYAWPQVASTQSNAGRPRLGVGIGGLTSVMARRGFERTLSRASLLLYDTANHAQKMRSRYPSAHVANLPLIVDPPILPDTPDKRRDTKDFVRFAFVANLTPNKRPQVFLETIQRLRERGIPAEGVVLGDGPERGALEAYSADVGIKFALRFAGKVPNAEVYQHLREAHFLVSTSLGEPYGRGIAEAMAVGTPAVCHRSGGPADFIADGEDGLLVEELTGDAYAARIAQTLRDQERWEVLSCNAWHKAQNWRSEVVLYRLENEILNIVQKHRSGMNS